MEFTGERYLPDVEGKIKYEHYHRYEVSKALVADKVVLDIASGEGYGSFLLSQTAAQVIGVDIDRETVEHAQSKYVECSNVQFLEGSCNAIPLEDNSIDVVVSFETIEHHDYHREMMSEIKRVLKPDGFTIISSPNKEVYSDKRDYQNPYHVKELYHDEFVELLKQYFSNVFIYGQKIEAASFLVPLDIRPSEGRWQFLGGHQASDLSPTHQADESPLKEPMYLIAVCSDLGDFLRADLSSFYLDFEGQFEVWNSNVRTQLKRQKDALMVAQNNIKLQNETVKSLKHELSQLKQKNNSLMQETGLLKRQLKRVESVLLKTQLTDQSNSQPSLLKSIESSIKETRLYPLVKSSKKILAYLSGDYIKQKEIEENLRSSGLFDDVYYYQKYPDVATAQVDGLSHYLDYGASEGRNPSALFDTRFYLKCNADVRKAGINPLVHYFLYGQAEGRSPSPHRDGRTTEKAKKILGTEIDIEDFAQEARSITFPTVSDPDVTVIVPVFNKIEYTLRCLRALSFQDTQYTFEVILADDHSTDETSKFAKLIDGLIHARNTENLGFLLNCNNAAKAAKGKYLVFLNNDTAPFTNWLSELLTPLMEDPQVGLVGSMLLFANGILQEAGGFIFEDASGWNYGRNGDPDDCRYNFVREVDYCSGASIAISKELWTQLEGFDEYYKPAYYEDTDLAFRVRALGHKVVYTPFSKVVHFEGISSGTDLGSGVKKYQSINRPKFQQHWAQELSVRPKPQSANFSVWKPYRKRTLLWIDAVTPMPDKDSGSADAFNFLKAAHENGWGVSFIPFCNPTYMAGYTESLQRLGIQCWYKPYFQSLKDYLKTYGSELDVIVLSRITVASLVIDDVQRYAPEAKIIFNTVDLHFLRQSRENAISQQLTQHDKSNVASLMKQELSMIERANLTVLISPAEEAIVKDILPSAKTSVIPIIRDIPGRQAGFSDRKDICFLGGFLHPPNHDAVQYFLDEIWGLVQQKLPDCRFIIAGSNMPDDIKALASESVIVKGFVPDLSTLFESVRLSVVPLRYGAGMKGKIVSSLSFGVPVVATSIAVEGMNLDVANDVAVADTPEAIRDAICRVYTSAELWESLSRRSLKKAHEEFSFEAVAPQVLETITSVLA